MLQGNFVFDCVVHAYSMSDANLLDRPDAETGRGSILRLGKDTRAPGSDLGQRPSPATGRTRISGRWSLPGRIPTASWRKPFPSSTGSRTASLRLPPNTPS